MNEGAAGWDAGGACVLDASALLAWLRDEPGAGAVGERLASSFVSAVNLSEVLQKSLSEGVEVAGVAEDLSALGVSYVGFGAEQASLAARMWARTRSLGLGIADRACLATAVGLGVPALTADLAWEGIEWEGLSVEVIR